MNYIFFSFRVFLYFKIYCSSCQMWEVPILEPSLLEAVFLVQSDPRSLNTVKVKEEILGIVWRLWSFGISLCSFFVYSSWGQVYFFAWNKWLICISSWCILQEVSTLVNFKLRRVSSFGNHYFEHQKLCFLLHFLF